MGGGRSMDFAEGQARRGKLAVRGGNYWATVGMNCGAFLALVSCSNPYAILNSVGSLHARPKNEMPTGKPKMNPAGTVISG